MVWYIKIEKSPQNSPQTWSYNSINEKFGDSKIPYLAIGLAYILEIEFALLFDSSLAIKKGQNPGWIFRFLLCQQEY